jgi:rhodanese-related sulfurtransferase
MSFVQNNWMLILVMFLSGAMLLWPLVQRRLSPAKEMEPQCDPSHQPPGRNPVDGARPANTRGRLPKALHPAVATRQPVGRTRQLTGRPVIAYCASEHRSHSAGNALAKMRIQGHLHAARRATGAWKDAGPPVEK